MNSFIENQNWRYATKKFDASKKVSAEDLEILKEAIRLSPSSYGLQPYKVLIIENAEIREQLKPVAWGQNQITDASQLIVFANKTQFGDAEIDSFIESISQVRGIPVESISGYGDFMKSKITPLEDEIKNTWTSKQTYLALANLISAAAELRIDVTPMEGFESEAFNEILGLKEKGLNASVIAAIGYRHEEDVTQLYKKVRKTNEELFINL
jgi:nitroreductase